MATSYKKFNHHSLPFLFSRTAESKGERTSASFVLERQRGLFGEVCVSWNVTSASNATLDISPTSGKVEFNEGEKFKILKIFSLEDEVSLYVNKLRTKINPNLDSKSHSDLDAMK